MSQEEYVASVKETFTRNQSFVYLTKTGYNFSSNISNYTPPQSMLLSKNAQFLLSERCIYMYEQIGS